LAPSRKDCLEGDGQDLSVRARPGRTRPPQGRNGRWLSMNRAHFHVSRKARAPDPFPGVKQIPPSLCGNLPLTRDPENSLPNSLPAGSLRPDVSPISDRSRLPGHAAGLIQWPQSGATSAAGPEQCLIREDVMTARQRSLGGAILVHAALGAAVIIAALAGPAVAQTGIPGVLAPGVAPELVQEGYVFTEGPVATADGGLYFSDIRVSKTYFLDAGGKISVARENTSGANGLALTRDGELLFAEGDGKRITKRNRDGSIAVLTEGPPGAPLL